MSGMPGFSAEIKYVPERADTVPNRYISNPQAFRFITLSLALKPDSIAPKEGELAASIIVSIEAAQAAQNKIWEDKGQDSYYIEPSLLSSMEPQKKLRTQVKIRKLSISGFSQLSLAMQTQVLCEINQHFSERNLFLAGNSFTRPLSWTETGQPIVFETAAHSLDADREAIQGAARGALLQFYAGADAKADQAFRVNVIPAWLANHKHFGLKNQLHYDPFSFEAQATREFCLFGGRV